MDTHISQIRIADLVSQYLGDDVSMLDCPRICLIASSPSAPLAADLWSSLIDLRAAGIELLVIFGHLKSAKCHQKALGNYRRVFGDEAALHNIRFLSSWRMRHLNEQALLEGLTCFMGGPISYRPGTQIKDLACSDLRASDSDDRLAKRAFRNVFQSAQGLTDIDLWPRIEPWFSEEPGEASLSA